MKEKYSPPANESAKPGPMQPGKKAPMAPEMDAGGAGNYHSPQSPKIAHPTIEHSPMTKSKPGAHPLAHYEKMKKGY
jgi:hypothetical protein